MDYREALLLEGFRLLSEGHKETVLEFIAELNAAKQAKQALREVLENRDGQIVHRAALERAQKALKGGR